MKLDQLKLFNSLNFLFTKKILCKKILIEILDVYRPYYLFRNFNNGHSCCWKRQQYLLDMQCIRDNVSPRRYRLVQRWYDSKNTQHFLLLELMNRLVYYPDQPYLLLYDVWCNDLMYGISDNWNKDGFKKKHLDLYIPCF